MSILGKSVRFIATLGVRILIAVEVYFIALLASSPFLCLAWSVIEGLNLTGFIPLHFIFVWLILGFIFWVPMYIKVEIKYHKDK